MKLVVVGNCQATPLTATLSLALPESIVTTVNLTKLERDHAQVVEDLTSADVVISQPLGPLFGDLSLDNLKVVARRLILIPNVFYAGFHPDMTYIGGPGQRLAGPTKDYHSAVAVYAYLHGLTVADCVATYDQILESIVDVEGFAAASAVELTKRCSEIGFPGEQLVDRLTAHSQMTMMTFNHPATPVFVWLAKEVAALGGFRSAVPWWWIQSAVDNVLTRDVAWPIAPAAAVLHDLPPVGRRVFRSPAGEVLDLASFVERSFDAYARVGRAKLMPRRDDLDPADFSVDE